MSKHSILIATVLGLGLLSGPMTIHASMAMEMSIDQYTGAAAEAFDTAQGPIDAFKARLAADDFDGVAKLLGLDPVKLATFEGIKDTFETIKGRAAKLVSIEDDGDQRIINLGDELWPFPFPVRKSKDGKWAFDTKAGLEEVLNRRIGENEIEAIKTARAYVDAQKDYASEDHDDDGVLEYAQKLISTPGQTDGLYWPVEQGDGDSPAGGGISQEQLEKAKAGDGYFGYRFRILRAQGNQVAGGRYHYVINGNMIGGFGLIAWPAHYGETGVNTFTVNQAGIVYQKDLGPETEAVANTIRRFNPDNSWEVVKD